MKNKRIILLLVAALIAVSLSGCGDLLNGLFGGDTPETLTVPQRVAAFADDLNDDNRTAAAILENFGPSGLMQQYDNAEDDAIFETAFPAADTHAFTIDPNADMTAITDDGYLEIAVDGTRTTTSGTLPGEYTFTMYRETSGNWLIFSIIEIIDSTETIVINRALDF